MNYVIGALVLVPTHCYFDLMNIWILKESLLFIKIFSKEQCLFSFLNLLLDLNFYNVYRDEETGEDCVQVVYIIDIYTNFDCIKMKHIEIYL